VSSSTRMTLLFFDVFDISRTRRHRRRTRTPGDASRLVG
jgi:hypothetical protein